MSYAASYALFNYTLDEPSKGLEYLNLRLVRAFERGLDPKSSEAGFVLTHVDMVKDSPMLIRGSVRVLEALEGEGDKRSNVNDGLREVLESMEKIEGSMEGMLSHPTQYISLDHADKDIFRYVEELQAIRVLVLPGLHLRNHFSIYVP